MREIFDAVLRTAAWRAEVVTITIREEGKRIRYPAVYLAMCLGWASIHVERMMREGPSEGSEERASRTEIEGLRCDGVAISMLVICRKRTISLLRGRGKTHILYLGTYE